MGSLGNRPSRSSASEASGEVQDLLVRVQTPLRNQRIGAVLDAPIATPVEASDWPASCIMSGIV